MSSNVQFQTSISVQKHSLLDQAQNLASKLKFRVARGLGTCIPPFRRWADQQQAAHAARIQHLNDQVLTHYGQSIHDQMNATFAHQLKKPITERKFQQIASHAEFLAIEKSVEDSLQSEDSAFAIQQHYAKAGSIVDAQAPALVKEIITASKCFRIRSDLIQKAEAGDSNALQVLTALSEAVIREEIHKSGFGFPHQQLKFEARLMLDRLNDPAGWARNRFKRFNEVIQRKSSTPSEVLTALRELSTAFELKHLVKGKRFEAPQDRLEFLTSQFRDLLFIDEMKVKSDIDPRKWLNTLTKHPVIIQCWQLGSSSDFLGEVQERIHEQVGLAASEKAVVSVSRDKVILESLLNVMAERAEPGIERNTAYHWMDVTSMPINMAYDDGNSAADFVRADFWKAMNDQVSKETSLSFESLRSATANERAQVLIRM